MTRSGPQPQLGVLRWHPKPAEDAGIQPSHQAVSKQCVSFSQVVTWAAPWCNEGVVQPKNADKHDSTRSCMIAPHPCLCILEAVIGRAGGVTTVFPVAPIIADQATIKDRGYAQALEAVTHPSVLAPWLPRQRPASVLVREVPL
mmetsp:Transcript_117290/g.233789  ORF Transcript_117290/g.233789 Transcript_117290/m.233789 type:complete len:144 (+) Transcript_117290:124-555(+)